MKDIGLTRRSSLLILNKTPPSIYKNIHGIYRKEKYPKAVDPSEKRTSIKFAIYDSEENEKGSVARPSTSSLLNSRIGTENNSENVKQLPWSCCRRKNKEEITDSVKDSIDLTW